MYRYASIIAKKFSKGIAKEGGFRRFFKWWFDLIKNMLTLIAVEVIAEKTESKSLQVVAAATQLFFSGYLLTYVLDLVLPLSFGYRRNKWHLLIAGLSTSILLLGVNYFIFMSVVDIVHYLASVQISGSVK